MNKTGNAKLKDMRELLTCPVGAVRWGARGALVGGGLSAIGATSIIAGYFTNLAAAVETGQTLLATGIPLGAASVAGAVGVILYKGPNL